MKRCVAYRAFHKHEMMMQQIGIFRIVDNMHRNISYNEKITGFVTVSISQIVIAN